MAKTIVFSIHIRLSAISRIVLISPGTFNASKAKEPVMKQLSATTESK
jgi:hypothetical protein